MQRPPCTHYLRLPWSQVVRRVSEVGGVTRQLNDDDFATTKNKIEKESKLTRQNQISEEFDHAKKKLYSRRASHVEHLIKRYQLRSAASDSVDCLNCRWSTPQCISATATEFIQFVDMT